METIHKHTSFAIDSMLFRYSTLPTVSLIQTKKKETKQIRQASLSYLFSLLLLTLSNQRVPFEFKKVHFHINLLLTH